MLYSLLMLAFCWRYSLGEWRHRLRSRLPSSWAAGGAAATSEAWPAAWRAEAAEHKLQLADSLQQLSWRHEFEADAWACRLMGAAGVPPQDWPARLLVLRRVAAAEGAEEEEEEAAYMEAGEALAGKAMQQLTAGDASGAQALLDRHLRLPVPASWLRCMTPEERARLLGTLLHTHPPLGRRIEQVQQLSAAAAASVC